MRNNIGTIFEIVKEISDELGWNYSHGNLTEAGLKSITVYPLVHLSLQQVQLDDYVSQVQFNCIIADQVNYLKTENESMDLVDVYAVQGFTENQNYAHILQDLYMKFALKLREKEMQYNSDISIVKPTTFTPFIEADKDVLAGYNIALNVNITSPSVTDCYNEI